jgi:hypothetical protein
MSKYFILICTLTVLICGCRSSVTSYKVSSIDDAPNGVRWIETRPYNIYVFVGGSTTVVHIPAGDHTPAKDVKENSPKLLYYGTTNLLYKVNGVTLDPNPNIWDVNYSGDLFSEGTFTIELNSDGTLKSAGVVSDSASGGASSSGSSTASSSGK